MKISWKNLKESLIINLAYWIIFIICRSLRIEYKDASLRNVYDKGETPIIALWHRRLLYIIYYHTHCFFDKEAYILVSQSRDGTRIGKIVEKFGLQYIQGSSSRGGAKGLKQLIRKLKGGATVGITPDGPRGPKAFVQKGVISLARLTGRPIVPVSYHPRHAIILKSWDNFIIPVPFSKAVVITGDEITIGRDDDKYDSYYEALVKKNLDALEL